MRNKGKVLALTLSAAALVAASVFGTMAYLTDNEAVTNTFTVGRVGLSLDEAKVNPDGTYVTDVNNRWQPTAEDPEQEYHLLPGHSYYKDPTVTVDEGSEESYVRMMVEVTFEKELTDNELATSLNTIFTGYDQTKWNRTDKTVSEDKKTITYEYRYHTTVDGKDENGNDAAQKLEPLFTAIAVPGAYTNETIAFLNGMEIVVTAHAIQADGFNNDADAAWKAFGEQVKTNP